MRILPVLLVTAVILSGCTSGSDKDGDGLEDGLETRHWGEQVVELMDKRIVRQPASDPTKIDTDGDGLTDQEEFFIRTDPSLVDTDEDGLTDCQEARHTVIEDCLDPDFDTLFEGDGGTGTDPAKADSDPGPSRYKRILPWVNEAGPMPENEIRFGDGLSDGAEFLGMWMTIGDRQVFVRPDPRQTDTDHDGLEDGEEVLVHGSNPMVPDTDGDGCLDVADHWPAHAADVDLGLLSVAPLEDVELQFTTGFLDRADVRPFEPIHAPGGRVTDLSGLTIERLAGTDCPSVLDGDPLIQITVYDFASERLLDLGSASNATRDGVIQITWDVSDGVFVTPDGSRLESPVEIHGRDGSLQFDPHLVLH